MRDRNRPVSPKKLGAPEHGMTVDVAGLSRRGQPTVGPTGKAPINWASNSEKPGYPQGAAAENRAVETANLKCQQTLVHPGVNKATVILSYSLG